MSVFRDMFGAPSSLQRKLVVNIVVALSFCVTLATAILVYEFFEHLEETLDETLATEAREVLSQVDPKAAHSGLDVDALRFAGATGVFRYTVFDADLAILAGGENSAEIQAGLAALVPGRPQRIDLADDRVGVGLKGQSRGQEVYVLVSTHRPAAGVGGFEFILEEMMEQSLSVLLGVVAILGAAVLATRLSLRPLDTVLGQAEVVGPDTPDRRLSTAALPSEIVPLVEAVNEAFARLEQGYRSQRDFSSNVAHEMRTPLAVLRSSVDRIADAQLRAELATDVGKLEQMLEQMIDLARSDALTPTAFESVDLRKVAVDLAADLAPDAIRNGRLLAVSAATAVPARGHPGLLSVALGNLVRNALDYSPAGTEVEIEVLADPMGFRVLDRGPGVPDDQKQALFERFHRGAPARLHPQGAGIGLAIVKSVADAHGARVRIEDRPGGGSVFSFRFGRGD